MLCTHSLINGTSSFFFGWGGGLLNTKCVFLCSLKFLTQTFLILGRINLNIIKNVYISTRKVTVLVIR